MAQTQAKPDAPQTTRGLTRVVPAHDPEWVAERKEARAQAVEADVRSAVEKLLHHCPSTRSDEATRARRALAENGSGLVYADAEDRCAYQLGWLLQRAQDLVKILNKITDERNVRALEDQLFDSKELNVMSLAGGPCSAAVGFAIWSHHRARFHSKHLKVKVSVYDLEAGWKPTCEQAQSAVQSTLASGAETGMEGAEIEIKWGGTCDLLQTTGKKMNAKIRASISEQQLLNFLTSCGCIDSRDDIAIETATSAGGFFHSLLWYLKVGTLILFVETSFNLAKAFGNMNGAYGKKLDRLYTSKAESDLQGLAGVFLYRVVASDSEEQTSDLYTTMRDLHIQDTSTARVSSSDVKKSASPVVTYKILRPPSAKSNS